MANVSSLSLYAHIERAFFQGRCAEVLELTIDSPFVAIEAACWPYIIGALAFTGRAAEAEIRFQTLEMTLDLEQSVACRFYLAVGLVRTSEYKKVKAYFIRNLQLLRGQRLSPMMAFYAWQGVGFYHLFRGLSSKALRAAERSLTAAIQADHYFARMLATDLLGHARVETGAVAQGLSELEMAYRLALRLGHDGYEKTINRAIMGYRAQYGLSPQDTISSLEGLIQETRIQDNYTDNYLSLELARQLTLRALISEAEKCLQDASRRIYASQHRRQRILLHLRWAELAYLKKDGELLLEKLQAAHSDIDPEIDIVLHLQWMGLALKSTCRGLAATQEQLDALSRRVGSGLARRIGQRQGLNLKQTIASSDDPLGDVIDSLGTTQSLTDAMLLVLNSPYLGFLVAKLDLNHDGRVIFIHTLPQVVLLCWQGDIRRLDTFSASKISDLLRALARGFRSKADLVREVWGYSYHPLRHDSLLYTLISRLRTALGNYADWLEHTSEGYQFASSVSVIVHEPEVKAAPNPTATTADLSEKLDLNPRQIDILKHLRSGAWLAVEDCADLTQTSKVTATRDLTHLVKAGLLDRVGKGRATHYVIASADTHNLISS